MAEMKRLIHCECPETGPEIIRAYTDLPTELVLDIEGIIYVDPNMHPSYGYICIHIDLRYNRQDIVDELKSMALTYAQRG